MREEEWILKQIRYDRYYFSAKEWILYVFIGIGLDAVIAFTFYRSIIAFIVFLPVVGLYIRMKNQELAKKQKKEMAVQFKDAILSVSASLNAGYSVENAFIESYADLKKLYGKREIIVREFEGISRRISANETLESILNDIADRSGVEDIRDFADVFITAKRSGGDMNSIIRRTALHIGEKIEIKRDIETVMSAKKMEQSIMNIVPILIILYLSINSPGFLDILYHNFFGVVVMSLCLSIYVLAYMISQKILAIEV